MGEMHILMWRQGSQTLDQLGCLCCSALVNSHQRKKMSFNYGCLVFEDKYPEIFFLYSFTPFPLSFVSFYKYLVHIYHAPVGL